MSNSKYLPVSSSEELLIVLKILGLQVKHFFVNERVNKYEKIEGTWKRRGKYVESFENVWWWRQPKVGLSISPADRLIVHIHELSADWFVPLSRKCFAFDGGFLPKKKKTAWIIWGFDQKFRQVNLVSDSITWITWDVWQIVYGQFFWGLQNCVSGRGYSHKISGRSSRTEVAIQKRS